MNCHRKIYKYKWKTLFIILFLSFNLISYAADTDYEWVTYNDPTTGTGLLPKFRWSCGCSPTAASMVLGYWDNYGPTGGGNWGKFTAYGRLIDYYIDEDALESYQGSDGVNFNWAGIWVDTWNDCLIRPKLIVDLAVEMDTTGAGGSTFRSNQAPGINSVVNSKGYGNNWANRDQLFCWTNLKGEIDDERPVMVSVPNHSVCCFGYSESLDKFATYDTNHEIRNDYDKDTLDDSIVKVNPENGTSGEDVDLKNPDGGENWAGGTSQTISWYQYSGSRIDNVDIYYSTDGGRNFNNSIASWVTSSSGWNSYSWTLPTSVDSSRMRIRIEGWEGGSALLSEDGSQENFEICSPPPAPTGVTASNGDYIDKIEIFWNNLPEATGYDIYRHTTNDSEAATLIGTNEGSSNNLYYDYGVIQGVTYWYWIKAKNDCGNSGFSASDSGWLKPTYTLSVNSSGASSVSISSTTGHGGTTNYTKTVVDGTSVNLQAPYYVGSGASRKRFDGWTGSVTSSSQSITFTMNGGKTVTANYIADPVTYTLSVNSSGASDVSISSTTGHGGTTNYNETVIDGTNVNLQAPYYVGSGASRKRFDGWTGSVTSSNLSITFTMDTSKTVTANYVADPVTYTLSVNSSGASSVSISSTTGHGGTTAYNKTVIHGTSVNLQAPQYIGSGALRMRFDSWTGSVASSNLSITFTMDTSKTVTANYLSNPEYTLSVSIQGQGNVTLNPSGGIYDDGTTVQLTASASPDWHFVRWEGDLSGSTNPTTIFMDSNKNVTAVFEEDASQYTLSVTPQGQGSVTLDPAGGTYDDGTTVQLTATASPDWHFVRWEGDLSGSTNPTTILMDSNKNVTAIFEEDASQYTLSVIPQGQGSVILDPTGGTYDDGTTVQLTATASPDWHFARWEGDLSGSTNPTTILMNSNKNVTAVFEEGISQYTLSVTPQGQGSVTLDPAGGTYDDGTTVQLTATASPDWHFVRWEGDLSGSINPTMILMDSNKSVTAVFDIDDLCHAIRTIPEYIEGLPVPITIDVTPEATVVVYAVEDTPPLGWVVSNINEGGTRDDVNKKVKWGPFFDNTPRTLTYDITAPVGASGCYSLSGLASFDGVDQSVCGNTEICILHVTWDFDPNTYIAESPVSVCLDVDPEASVMVYAVEDSPPFGWTVTDINEGGTWDDVNKKVKWGPYFDSNPRTLCYNATPPAGETGEKIFTGTASFDGVDEPVERTITDCAEIIADFDNDCDVDFDDLAILVGNWLESY